MDKRALLKKLLALFDAELASYAKSAREAHAEATHEQNKAENKYDTRALEASYLARGQARQMAETEQARTHLEALDLKAFGPQDPIDLGALVTLEENGSSSFFFIAPRGGGTEIRHNRKTILVLTPQSPLGRQLIGKCQGDRLTLQITSTASAYRVLAVE